MPNQSKGGTVKSYEDWLLEKAIAKRIEHTFHLWPAVAGEVVEATGDGQAIPTAPRFPVVVEAYSASSAVTELPLLHGTMPTDPDDGYVGIPTPSATVFRSYAASVRSDAGGGPGNEWTATLHVRPYGGSFSPVATFQLNT